MRVHRVNYVATPGTIDDVTRKFPVAEAREEMIMRVGNDPEQVDVPPSVAQVVGVGQHTTANPQDAENVNPAPREGMGAAS